jgi:RND family efflux transporter MFP subunit
MAPFLFRDNLSVYERPRCVSLRAIQYDHEHRGNTKRPNVMSSSAGRFDLKSGKHRNSGGRALTWILVILLLLIAGGLAFVAVVYKIRNDPKTARALKGPMPVEAVKAQVKTIEVTVGASGQILQFATVNVTSRITSIAQQVPVNIGDLVTKEQELMHADRRPFEAAVAEANSQITASQSAIDKDQKDLDGVKDLYAKGLAALIEVQTAQAALDKVKADLAEAQKDLVNDNLDLEFTRLTSPVNGIVLARFVNPNERFQVNQVLMQLGDLDKVYFLANVQEEMVGYITGGQSAEVVFPSYPSASFKGTVEHIDPRTDPKTRTFTAYITIPNKDLQLKPGISGFARIRLKKTGLMVPSVAVMNIVGENAAVYIINAQSEALLTPVRLGLSAGGMTEILEGVNEGDIVATVGALYLKTGDKVNMTLTENWGPKP